MTAKQAATKKAAKVKKMAQVADRVRAPSFGGGEMKMILRILRAYPQPIDLTTVCLALILAPVVVAVLCGWEIVR